MESREERSPSAQSSEFRRIIQTQSLPNIGPVVVAPSDFLKTFQKLSKSRSSAQRAIRLNHLKNAQIRSVDEDAFNKVIRHLEDVLNQPKFQRSYVELQPMKSVTGFLETGESQYFTVGMAGCASPMHIEVKKDKGSVICYFSYTSLKPGPEIYDLKFKSHFFKVSSKFATFREAKGCFCIFAESEANVTVTVAFGGNGSALREGVRPRKSVIFTKFDAEDEDSFVPTPVITRSHVSREPSEIPADLLSQSFNFIEANKQIRLKTPSRLHSINQSRQLQAKLRRIEFQSLTKDRIVSLAEKVERRQDALTQAKYIAAVLHRKDMFERGWLRLIYFAKVSWAMRSRFVGSKMTTLRMIRRSYACYRFQKVFRKRFGDEFDVKYRTVAMAGYHLKLNMIAAQAFQKSQITKKLYSVIYTSYSDKRISQSIRIAFARILMIQRNWRRKRMLDNYYFRHIYDLWDKIVTDEEAKWLSEYNSKRKDSKGRDVKKPRRFILINEVTKMSYVRQALHRAKEKYRDFHRSLERRATNFILFLPSYDELRETILSLAIEARHRKLQWVPVNARSLRGSLIDIKPH